MSSIFAVISIFTGKAMIFLMRLSGRNATTLPGKTALWLYKKLPAYLTRNKNVTIITGTNGKTTTTRMLCSIYESAGFRVVTNVSGANLASGVITALIENLSFSDMLSAKKNSPGNNRLRIVLEMDEGAFGRYSASLNPSVIAITNLFRDQLDRYGELSITRELIRKGIRESVKAAILLCSDDSLCASLAEDCKGRNVFCGIGKASMREAQPNLSAATEAGNCVFCGEEYDYSHRSFGHLGYYKCPGCGFTRPEPSFHCEYEKLENNMFHVYYKWKGEKIDLILPIPGEFNVYNAMTAVAAACMNGISLADTKKGLLLAKAGFGRMERFNIEDRDVCIVLVKNPVGLERALDFLANATDAGSVLFLLNDGIADGTDVSWIWDVDFESKKIPGDIHVSGSRCYDMALRLMYAGADKDAITVSYDFTAQFEKALKACEKGECLYVLPNYTSLLELRSYLSKTYHLKEIWK
ncbi:MAG: DUF1727 domain-containing protein [Saccharofermentanales bacterium]